MRIFSAKIFSRRKVFLNSSVTGFRDSELTSRKKPFKNVRELNIIRQQHRRLRAEMRIFTPRALGRGGGARDGRSRL